MSTMRTDLNNLSTLTLIEKINELEAQLAALRNSHKALGTILERFEPCLKDYIFSKRYALIDARVAFNAARAGEAT